MNLLIRISLTLAISLQVIDNYQCQSGYPNYQTGVYSPCIPQLCDFTKGKVKLNTFYTITYTFQFKQGFKSSPKLQLYIVSLNNTYSPEFFIDDGSLQLTGASFTFVVLLKTKSINFTIGWIATLEDNIHLMDYFKDPWIANKTYTLNYPKLINRPLIIQLLRKSWSNGTSAEVQIQSFNQNSVSLIRNVEGSENIILFIVDEVFKTNTNQIIQVNSSKSLITKIETIEQINLTYFQNHSDLVYGITQYQITGDPFLFSQQQVDNVIKLDYDNWTNMINFTITTFVIRFCQCLDGYFENITECSPCKPPCKTCLIKEDSCQSCINNLQVKTNICQCQNGYFDDDFICKQCLLPCVNCLTLEKCSSCDVNLGFQLNVDKCVCSQGYYHPKSQTCKKCRIMCLDCNNTNCIECQNNAHTSQEHCLCNKGYFEVNEVCQACQDNCLDCSELKSCTLCDENYLFYDGHCKCSEGHYIEIINTTQKCKKCQAPCNDCNVLSSNCTSCLQGYELVLNQCQCYKGQYMDQDDKCQQCKAHCIECSSFNQCKACNFSMGLTLTNQQCICQNGYFDTQTNLCQLCGSLCLNCSSSICHSCVQNAYSKNDGVDCGCGDGYYYSDQQCKQCIQNCLKCSNDSSCSKCKGGYNWSNGTNQCQIKQASKCEEKCELFSICSSKQGQICICQQFPRKFVVEYDSDEQTINIYNQNKTKNINKKLNIIVQGFDNMTLTKTVEQRYIQFKIHPQRFILDMCVDVASNFDAIRQQLIIPLLYPQLQSQSEEQKIIVGIMNKASEQIQNSTLFNLFDQLGFLLLLVKSSQVIAQLQFLNYTTAQNVYGFERLITTISFSKKVPEWEVFPQNITSLSSDIFLSLNLVNETFQGKYLRYERISFNQYLTQNLDIGILVICSLYLLQIIIKLLFRDRFNQQIRKYERLKFQERCHDEYQTVQYFKFIILNDSKESKLKSLLLSLNQLFYYLFLEGKLAILTNTCMLFVLSQNQFSELCDQVNLALILSIVTLYFIIMVGEQIRLNVNYRQYASVRDYQSDNNGQLQEYTQFILEQRLRQKYKFFLQRMSLASQINLQFVFIFNMKKWIFAICLTLLYGEVKVQLAILLFMHVFIFFFILIYKPYNRKIQFAESLLMYLALIAILCSKIVDLYRIETIMKSDQVNLDDVKQWINQGWITISFELFYLLVTYFKLISSLVIARIDYVALRQKAYLYKPLLLRLVTEDVVSAEQQQRRTQILIPYNISVNDLDLFQKGDAEEKNSDQEQPFYFTGRDAVINWT